MYQLPPEMYPNTQTMTLVETLCLFRFYIALVYQVPPHNILFQSNLDRNKVEKVLVERSLEKMINR